MMSVLVVIMIALIMLTVLTLMVATTVHVILDTLEMASTAQVCYLELHAISQHIYCAQKCLRSEGKNSFSC